MSDNYIPCTPANIPVDLQNIPQWVVWRYEQKPDKTKLDKVPHSPLTGGMASSTNPSTWSTFDQALQTYQAGGYHGLGLVVTLEAGIVGVDIDHVVIDGKLSDEFRQIVDCFGSYTEISPSGTGIRIFAYGLKQPGRCKKPPYEIYQTGRFLTVTGCPLDNQIRPVIESQDAIDWYQSTLLTGRDDVNLESVEYGESCLTAQEVIEKASEADNADKFKRLYYEGDLSDYGHDHSSADLALCTLLAFWTNGDGHLMEKMFNGSALYREKWADRADYRSRTINRAIASCTEFYTSRRQQTAQEVFGMMPQQQPCATRGISAADLMAMNIPETRWAVEGLLPEGLAVLAGKPKLGKSWASLQLGIAVASGKDFLNCTCQQGEAVYLALEDGMKRIQKRVKKILAGDAIPSGLTFHNEWPPLDDGGMEELDKLLTERKPKVVVIDTWQKVRPLKKPRGASAYEVDYAEAGKLKALADKHHACILIVHHLRKSDPRASGGDVFEKVNGSAGITGVADSILILDRSRGVTDAELHVTGRDVEEGKLALSRDNKTMRWRNMGNAQMLASTHEQQIVLDAVRHLKECSPKEVADYTEIAHDYVRKALGRLVHHGQVQKKGYGKYAPVETLSVPTAPAVYDIG